MSSVYVGNDIVDLASPRADGRATDDRFVERVFDEDERSTVRGSSAPDLELWCHWAAKEAGFKVISKLVGSPPPFVHRAFKVRWSELRAADPQGATPPGAADAGPVIRRGSVTWHEYRTHVSVSLHPGGVHAAAFATRERPTTLVRVWPRVALLDSRESPWAGALESLLPRFTEREADAVYSLPSAAVRVGARGDLAQLIGVTERRLEIVCAPGPRGQRAPRVLLDGEETEADVSLSHDGRLIAWTLWVGHNLRNAS